MTDGNASYEERRRAASPKRSTTHMRSWRDRYPEKAALARAREDERNAAVDEMATQKKRLWSDEERAFVRTHPELSHHEIASRLGRTVRSVEGYLRRRRQESKGDTG